MSEKIGKTVLLKQPKDAYLLDPELLDADSCGRMYRVCGDFRQINTATAKCYYLSPSTQEILDDVGIVANKSMFKYYFLKSI